MKPEELLYSMDHVGEDLLAEAEQTILVRKRRPWLGAAAAAALALAVGVSGFLLLKKHLPGKTPAQPGNSDTVATSEPEDALPMFSVGSSYTDRSVWSFDDPERSLAVNRWTLETGVERLPVYARTAAQSDAEAAEGYSVKELEAICSEAIQRLGAAPAKDIEVHCNEAGTVDHLEAGTELGTLTVDAAGRVCILFDEAHALSAFVKLDFARELTEQEMEIEYRNAIMQLCGEQVEKLLGLPPCHPAVCDDWNSFSSAYQSYLLYPIREDPAEQLKSRFFEMVRLLTVSGREVVALAWDHLPQAGESGASPRDYELMGNYPVVSPEKARSLALAGDYFSETKGLAPLSEDDLTLAELVYLPAESNEILLPFYRFWVSQPVPWDVNPESGIRIAVLVPAVDSAWLADYPVRSQSPEPDTEPAPIDTDLTETTEAYDPTQDQLPVLQNPENGRFTISGPAGTVEALHYMGIWDPEPIWADLDGDGQRELVYWCSGPTSGLFTAGLCVYGLEDGWPVLKAGQFYNLYHYAHISLSAEDDTVFLHLSRIDHFASADEAVMKPEELYPVTMKDGKLLLNGGELPEGCELWGGPEWTWFGSSFAAMKTVALEAGFMNDMPRLRVYENSCVVWIQISLSSVPPARQRVFAAVTDNGVTVTGLLCYEPKENGEYFCAMQGIETIEAPADPAALIGLSAETLEERFGPRHFETDDPTPKPCWFTADCRLLTVSVQDGFVTEAALTALSPQPLTEPSPQADD
ncbi:MAG: hypothetical protein IKQ54_08665 [Oscillospiraceae bacterium]|nr:hypothetical protein [Oscillospiraceae bacterium]